jgi:3-deoxy-D-manno-octulosonic-acid transferase
MHIIYDIIFLIFVLLYLPYFLLKGKYHKGIWQRLGFVSLQAGGRPVIWLHAVSVGEVASLKTFWRRLREEFPSALIAVSTVTKNGNTLARQFAVDDEIVFYIPLDMSFLIDKVLKALSPKMLIIAETEIWPNLIGRCHKKGVPVLLVNGRISDRAFPKYRMARFLLRGLLEKIDLICARTDEDKKRFIALGASPENVKTAGNMKYCNVAGEAPGRDEIRKELSLKSDAVVFTAGSTHKGEEEIILEVFRILRQDFKNLYLVIAPRYIERAEEIKRTAKGRPVTVIDKIGILSRAYSVSDIVFVGGSLVPHGGHNIIEPAVFARPIIFGPYMFNFQDETREFLKGGAAIMVKDGKELLSECKRLLGDNREMARLGQNAKGVVAKNQGAVENCIAEVKKAWDD